jgi:hypothetical protein
MQTIKNLEINRERKNVLQAIKNLEVDPNFIELNFQLNDYKDSRGR